MKTLRFKTSPLPVYLIILLFAVSCLTLSSCSKDSSASIDPQAEYNTVVQDAQTMTSAKISKNLTAIVPENTNLIFGLPSLSVCLHLPRHRHRKTRAFLNCMYPLPTFSGHRQTRKFPVMRRSWLFPLMDSENLTIRFSFIRKGPVTQTTVTIAQGPESAG
ncbi:MAG: hypothetical protein WAW31_05240 [Smithella sp.]